MSKFSLCVLMTFGMAYSLFTNQYPISTIPPALREKANSVIRLEEELISIPDQRTKYVKHKRVVSVLNSNGDREVDSYMHYDPTTRIKDIGAIVYDAQGKEIKRYKKRDFKDISAVDGISIFTDSRLLYLDHTASSYPYTIEFFAEVASSNTAFLGSWYANSTYYLSIEKSIYEIKYNPDLNLRFEAHDPTQIFELQQAPGLLRLEANAITALAPEDYSPSLNALSAHYNFALEHFHLEGVDGSAQNWKEFGQWINAYLLDGTQEIPPKTIQEVKALVSGVSSKIDKARLVYQYMQEKTRYISVQVGIGGWKPMLAEDVDKLGYGDCKALTNYTKSLLAAVDIPSYYTVLYAGRDKRDISKDFVAMQGNHAILAIPEGDDYLWLECTNQQVPFGFIGDFTDDRDVLIVTPEGGKIVHTKEYAYQDSTQDLKGEVYLDSEGGLKAEVTMSSSGIQYDDRYFIDTLTETDQKKHYYNFWEYLNNLTIDRIALENDKENIVFKENIALSAARYASFAGPEMLVHLNALNRMTASPVRYRDRKFGVEVGRGFSDSDQVTIHLPEGYSVSGLPEPIVLETDFGFYQMSCTAIDENTLLYKRQYDLYGGSYEKQQYKDFRSFKKKIARYDNQKIILTKND
ncbi:MAG: DUF3857 domain-containing protein [Cytophagaceae bacterium]|nr:DUF3857 domain-containing protein [Cytophagaceae bacterium]